VEEQGARHNARQLDPYVQMLAEETPEVRGRNRHPQPAESASPRDEQIAFTAVLNSANPAKPRAFRIIRISVYLVSFTHPLPFSNINRFLNSFITAEKGIYIKSGLHPS
jgi:hypothetical protein